MTPAVRATESWRAVPWTAAALLLAMGATVLVAWHARLEAVLQVRPSWVPMQYNTALSFVLLGTALFFILLGRDRMATICAALLGVIAGLTLAEYVAGVDLGIDELMMDAYLAVETSHPGRMAPNSALCFALAAAALIAMSGRATRRQSAAAGLLGLFVAALGGVALAGYLSGLPTAYGWGNLTRMAVHTSAGFVLAGGALSALAIPRLKVLQVSWQPPAVTITTGVIVIALWQALVAAQASQALRETETVARALSGQATRFLGTHTLSLERMAARWQVRPPSRQEWDADALGYIGDTIFQSISWVDASYHLRWIVPAAGNEAAVGLDLGATETARTALEAARASSAPTLTDPLELPAIGLGFIELVPIHRAGTFDGFILGVMSAETLFRDTMAMTAPLHAFWIQSGDNTIYATSDQPPTEGICAEAPIDFLDKQWTLVVEPLAGPSGRTSGLLLMLGLGLAGALGWAVQQSHVARSRSEQLAASVDELVARGAELERANHELEQFAYVASHDLRSPLRGIDQLALWIEEDLGPDLGGESRDHLRLLRGRVARMNALLTSLLEYARVGRANTPPEQVDVAAVVREVIDLVPAPETFRFEVSAGLPTLHTNRAALQQVLLNLVSNAVKHRARDDGRVRIDASYRQGIGEFVVEDDGPGIPEELRDKAFEMFQTLRPRDQVEGSGMGLALVRKHVETVGGTLKLERVDPHGARFRFTWPGAPDETSDSVPADLPERLAS